MQGEVAYVADTGIAELKRESVKSPGRGEVLLKALFSSMSPGTEHSLMAGDILALPQRLGYSLVASVVEVGSEVSGIRAGDKVVATAAHASYQVVDQRLVTPVPDNTDLEQAAFFNLGHTALYSLRQTELQLGESCLVMGQGLVGALTAQLARTAGAVPVVVTDLNDSRLALARAMGIQHAYNPQKDSTALSRVQSELSLQGFPVVFEATGKREPLVQAIELVGERGRVAMMSQGGESLSSKALQDLMMKGARLIGGYINSKPFNLFRSDLVITDQWPPLPTRELERTAGTGCWTSDEDIRVFLRLIQSGYLDISQLISHRFHYSEIPQAYDLVWQKAPELMGGLISWEE